MLKQFVNLSAAVGLCLTIGCAPRDVPLDGTSISANSNGGGGIQSFKSVGERSTTCPKASKNHTFIVKPEYADVSKIKSGSVKALIQAGNRNCFEIGSTIRIKPTFSSSETLGQVKVEEAIILPVNSINDNYANLMGLSLSEAKTFAQGLLAEIDKNCALKKAGQPTSGPCYGHKGIVNLTVVSTGGASPSGGGSASNTGAQLFDAVGERPSTCPADKKNHTFIIMPEYSSVESLKSGEVSALVQFGNRNCFEIGSTINVKPTFSSKDVLMDVKVDKVAVLNVSSIDEEYAKLMGLGVSEAVAAAQKGLDAIDENCNVKDSGGKPNGPCFPHRGMISLTMVSPVGGSANVGSVTDSASTSTPQDAPVAPFNFTVTKKFTKAATCKEGQAFLPISFEDGLDSSIIDGDSTAFLQVGSDNCLRVSTKVNVQGGQADPARLQVKVEKVVVVDLNLIDFEEHASALNMTAEQLKTFADSKLKNNESNCSKGLTPCVLAENTVNITYFSFSKVVGEVSTPSPQQAPPAVVPLLPLPPAPQYAAECWTLWEKLSLNLSQQDRLRLTDYYNQYCSKLVGTIEEISVPASNPAVAVEE